MALGCLLWVTAPGLGTIAEASADELPKPLEEAIEGALDAWSEFAARGDLAATEGSFAASGPQRRRFELESSTNQVSPGLSLRSRELRVRTMNEEIATVWAEIEVRRPGFRTEVVWWDFDLIEESTRWLVWTVVPAEFPPTAATALLTPISTASELPGATPLAPTNTDTYAPEAAATEPDSPHGFRLPANVAWIIVVTLVGVAVAGYMAPRIDRRRGE
jgi:hypothetical protein